MKFICASLPKTGTKTLSRALKILGFNVWDFDKQVINYMDDWLNLFKHGAPMDFYSKFKDVDVVTDFPCYIFVEELMEAFPDAKVILSEREEDSWARSYKNQIEIVENSYLSNFRYLFPTYNKFFKIMRYGRMASLGVIDPLSSYIYRKRYREHNDRVKAVVPKEKLLVYSVDQGWKPLCEFTGMAIPEEPFPHMNVRGSIFYSFRTETELGRKIVREMKLVLVCIALVVIFIGMLLAKAF